MFATPTRNTMTSKQRSNILFGLVFLVGVLAFMAQAQASAPEAQVQSKTLLDYWKVGGFAMYPIGLCSVGAVALGVYCFLLYSAKKMTQPDIYPLLNKALEALDIKQALSICSSAPGILTNVFGAGLRRLVPGEKADMAAVEKAMEEASVEEVNDNMKPLTYLSVIVQVAPMFGLLGTVTGMIGAFNKLGSGAAGTNQAQVLADNIGEAMITTAFGLIVAIPAMFIYFGFKSQFTGNVSRISRLAGELTHTLAAALRRTDNGAVPLAPTPQEEPGKAEVGNVF